MISKLGTFVLLAAIGTSSAAFADASPQFSNSDINTKISTAAHYPSSARSRGEEGTVSVVVTIGEGGSVKDAAVESSSGVKALDDAAVSAVRAAAPFTQPTSGVAVVHTKFKYVIEN
jgi:protein TonB